MSQSSPENQPSLQILEIKVKKVSELQKRRINLEFPAARRRFLRSLVKQRGPELADQGLTFAQITRMKRGHTPKKGRYRWVVHHVIPRSLTGRLKDANASKNLCLLKQSTHRLLHEYIDPQVEDLPPAACRRIRLPVPPAEFYSASRQQAFGQIAKAKANSATVKQTPFPALSRWALSLLRSRLIPSLQLPASR